MVHFAHSIPLLVFIVAVMLNASTVTAMPLPFQQATLKHPPRVTYVKPSNQNTHSRPARIMIKMSPEASTALRGSSLASRHIAEAKRDQDNNSLYLDKARKQSVLFVSYDSDSSSTGWRLDGDIPIVNDPLLSGNLLGLSSKDESGHGDKYISQSPDRPITASTASSTAVTPKAMNMEKFTGSQTPPNRNVADISRQQLANEKKSSTFPHTPPWASLNSAEPFDHEALHRVTIVNPISRAKAKEVKQRIQKDVIDWRDPRRRSRVVLDQSKLIRDTRQKMEHLSVRVLKSSHTVKYSKRQEEEEGKEVTESHRDLHRPRIEPVSVSVIKVGQLAIVQPLSGASRSTGESHLMAHLALAPNIPTSQANATSGDAEQKSSAVTADSPNVVSFSLSPSSSSTGFKLEMVEIHPSTDINAKKWKYVKFQATLTNPDNKPQLYCATLQSSNKLQMEPCKDTSNKESNDEEKRIFLYNSSTGEVFPSQPDVPPSTQESQQAVAQAVAQLSGGQSSDSSYRAYVRQMETTESSSVISHPRPVKLVFFLDQPEQNTETIRPNSIKPALNDEEKPPLLRF